MLEPRGHLLLATALGLVAGGLAASMAGPVLAGVLLLGALLTELLRLRTGLTPGAPPCGVTARLVVDRGEADADAGAVVRAHRPGRAVPLRLQMVAPPTFAGLRFDALQWWTSPGVEMHEGGQRTLQLGPGGAQTVVHAVPHNAAVHRVLGIEGRLLDGLGLVSAKVFVPCPCELAVLPRSLPLDLRRVAETRRNAPRSGGGSRPDRVPGHGDDLRELREHRPGDPFKHIAWKASAARGRLTSRSFEREQTRSLYVVLDTGATMRDGRPGSGPLDQAFDLVHSLAEAAARSHDPFGLALVDGRVVDQRPVLEGLASLRDTDRALLDVRRAVAEDLAPMDEDELLVTVARYLVAIERVPLPGLGAGGERAVGLALPVASMKPGQGEAARLRLRQRVVMAALARLPERERVPLLRGPEPSARPELAILRRFCRAMDLPLPYRHAPPAARRVDGLVAGVQAAMAARKGPFAVMVVSDFRRLSGACAPLWLAFARARRAGCKVMAVAVREVDDRDVLDLAQHVDDIDTARGLVRADSAARQQLLDELQEGATRAGAAFLADPQPQELVALWRHG